MQKRLWLGVLVVGLPTAIALGATGAGCGGSSDDSAATPDSGSDVTQAKDTAAADVVTVVDAGRCDDADIENLNLPDAALGDSGASVATCLSCTESSCATQVTACNASCQCKNDIDDALKCIANAGGLSLSCAGGLLTGTDTAASNLGQCLAAACQSECGIGGFGDGGIKDASDDGG